MKSLTWYLLNEAQEQLIVEDDSQLNWNKLKEPAGGRSSNTLKDWSETMGLKNLKINNSKDFKCNTLEGKKDIKSQMKISSNDFVGIFTDVFKKTTLLSLLGNKKVNKLSVDGKTVIEIELINGWESKIMSKANSSMRFLRFWLESIIIACGLSSGSQVRKNFEIKFGKKGAYIKSNL